MANLPVSTDFTGSSVTQGGFKTAITSLRTFISDLLGTNSSDKSAARTALGLGDMSTQNPASVSISGGVISGITDLSVVDGGTGASTASGARTNLGLGTASVLDVGVTANKIVQLDSSAKLPAVDGSQITGLNTSAKAWVSFTGSTGAILAQSGVSSVTRHGVGDYTINFSSGMVDVNYVPILSAVKNTQETTTNDGFICNVRSTADKTVNSFRIVVKRVVGGGGMDSNSDSSQVYAAIFR